MPVRETKCNFCLDWMIVNNYLQNSLHICPDCLQQHQAGADVRDQNGQTYSLYFIHHPQPSAAARRDASARSDILTKHCPTSTWSQVHTLLEESALPAEEKQLLESRITFIRSEAEVENLIDLIKELSRCPSRILSECSGLETQARSTCFNSAIKQLGGKESRFKLSQNHNLDDLCSDLKETRVAGVYTFHYNDQEIESFKEGEKAGRCFGSDLSNSHYDDLFLNLRRREGEQSSQSDRLIGAAGCPTLRLGEEEVKQRIDGYLQPRYPSLSLARIVGSSVK